MAETYITGARGEPPILMFVGESDLPVMLENLDDLAEHLKRKGLSHQIVRIAGATHFYLRTAGVTADDGSRTDVESLMASFLHDRLKLGELQD